MRDSVPKHADDNDVDEEDDGGSEQGYRAQKGEKLDTTEAALGISFDYACIA